MTLIALGWLETILVRDFRIIPTILLCFGIAFPVFGRFYTNNKTYTRAILVLGCTIVVSVASWLLSGWFPLKLLGQIAAITAGFHCFYLARRLARRKDQRVTGARSVYAVLALLATAVAASISGVLVMTSVTADPAVHVLARAAKAANAFTAPAAARVVGRDGSVRISDVEYGSRFPNSFLDVYLAGGGAGGPRPTFVYVHGGGYVAGDKLSGAPNAGAGGYAGHQADVLGLGYNVVQVNYALAPEYRYPTPLIQLSQAVAFLQRHAPDYNLDMDRVVVGGESAGGHLAAQFALVQTNASYAAEVGLAPVLRRTSLRGLLLESPPLDMERSFRTQAPDLVHDLMFGLALRSYLGVSDADDPRSRSVRQANIIVHATSDFPATFVGDGNYGTFPDQARSFADRLRELKVPVTLVLFDRQEAKLDHAFMAYPSKFTEVYLGRKHAYLRALFGMKD